MQKLHLVVGAGQCLPRAGGERAADPVLMRARAVYGGDDARGKQFKKVRLLRRMPFA